MARTFALILMLAAAIGMAVPAAAQPKAKRGEPALVQAGKDASGSTIFQQTYTGAAQRVDEPVRLSIAQAYWAMGGDGANLPAATVRVQCRIGHAGRIFDENCQPIDGTPEDAAKLYRAAEAGKALPSIRNIFPKLKRPSGTSRSLGPWVRERYYQFDLALPAMTAPVVDLQGGDEVSPTLVTGNVGRILRDYPGRALRADAVGDLTLSCQVQQDLSIICNDLSFEPSDYYRYFTAPHDVAMRRTFGGTRASAALQDGRDARGVRFKPVLKFRIAE